MTVRQYLSQLTDKQKQIDIIGISTKTDGNLESGKAYKLINGDHADKKIMAFDTGIIYKDGKPTDETYIALFVNDFDIFAKS